MKTRRIVVVIAITSVLAATASRTQRHSARSDAFGSEKKLGASEAADGSIGEHLEADSSAGASKKELMQFDNPFDDPLETTRAVIHAVLIHIPVVGGLLGEFVNFFWPTKTPQGVQPPPVWPSIEQRVQNLIDEEILEAALHYAGSELTNIKVDLEKYADATKRFDPALHAHSGGAQIPLSFVESKSRGLMEYIETHESRHLLATIAMPLAHIHLSALREMYLFWDALVPPEGTPQTNTYHSYLVDTISKYDDLLFEIANEFKEWRKNEVLTCVYVSENPASPLAARYQEFAELFDSALENGASINRCEDSERFVRIDRLSEFRANELPLAFEADVLLLRNDYWNLLLNEIEDSMRGRHTLRLFYPGVPADEPFTRGAFTFGQSGHCDFAALYKESDQNWVIDVDYEESCGEDYATFSCLGGCDSTISFTLPGYFGIDKPYDVSITLRVSTPGGYIQIHVDDGLLWETSYSNDKETYDFKAPSGSSIHILQRGGAIAELYELEYVQHEEDPSQVTHTDGGAYYDFGARPIGTDDKFCAHEQLLEFSPHWSMSSDGVVLSECRYDFMIFGCRNHRGCSSELSFALPKHLGDDVVYSLVITMGTSLHRDNVDHSLRAHAMIGVDGTSISEFVEQGSETTAPKTIVFSASSGSIITVYQSPGSDIRLYDFKYELAVSPISSNYPTLLDGNFNDYLTIEEADLPMTIDITFDNLTTVTALGIATEWHTTNLAGSIAYSIDGNAFVDASEFLTSNSDPCLRQEGYYYIADSIDRQVPNATTSQVCSDECASRSECTSWVWRSEEHPTLPLTCDLGRGEVGGWVERPGHHSCPGQVCNLVCGAAPSNMLAIDGCSTGVSVQPACLADDAVAGIRCCALNALSCMSYCTADNEWYNGELQSSSTFVEFKEASDFCAAQGRRLCLPDEMEICCGTGCGGNDHLVWTSLPCNPGVFEQNVFELDDLPPIQALRVTIDDAQSFPALISELQVDTIPKVSVVDGCTNDPCQNGGLCVAGGEFSFTCDCANGFAGHNCEVPLHSNCDAFDGLAHSVYSGVCCSATSCPNGCGGSECDVAPSSASDCCGKTIIAADNVCGEDTDNAPCVLPTPLTSFQTFDMEVSWFDAQAICRYHGGELPLIRSAIENERVVASINVDGLTASDKFWIGATDLDSEVGFVGVDGANLVYTNWKAGEPNNDQQEDCVEMAPAGDGKWNDNKCDSKHRFVCQFSYNNAMKATRQMEPAGFRLYEMEANWEDARTACQYHGGDLPLVRDDEENQRVHAAVSGLGLAASDGFWIGYTRFDNNRLSHFLGIDGVNMTFTNWNGDEGTSTNEHCVEMRPTDGQWADDRCSFGKRVVCQI